MKLEFSFSLVSFLAFTGIVQSTQKFSAGMRNRCCHCFSSLLCWQKQLWVSEVRHRPAFSSSITMAQCLPKWHRHWLWGVWDLGSSLGSSAVPMWEVVLLEQGLWACKSARKILRCWDVESRYLTPATTLNSGRQRSWRGSDPPLGCPLCGWCSQGLRSKVLLLETHHGHCWPLSSA